jgi:hypothetical protein
MRPGRVQKPRPEKASLVHERRKHRRFRFNAAITIQDPDSCQIIQAHLSDLSLQGCYVVTGAHLLAGTPVDVTITRGGKSCAIQARVVYSRESKGMSLIFTDIAPVHLRTLSTWIRGAHESEWLGLSGRKGHRVLVKVPLRVLTKDANGLSVKEDTETLAISPHGALILLSRALYRGQLVYLANMKTKAIAQCMVVHMGGAHGERIEVGVEFLLPSPGFWNVRFPPKDWSPRHPDARASFEQ